MIILQQLTKVVDSRNVLSSVSLEIPSNRRIALVGDKDKQIVIGLLAGVVMPTAGRVLRKAETSFLVGQLPGFSKDLSIRINVAHVARLYGANVRQTLDVVEPTLDIGKAFDRPYDDLPRDLRRPLAQIVAFALPFDVYMLPDDNFRPDTRQRKGHKRQQDYSAACFALFQARLQTSGMIIPTDNPKFAEEYCDMGLVLHQGRLDLIEDVKGAFEQWQRLRQDVQIKRRRLRMAR